MFVNRHCFFLILPLLSAMLFVFPVIVSATNSSTINISEIAWMGTGNSANDEWIELYNNTPSPIDITNWTIKSTTGSLNIILSGIIPAEGYFILERTNDQTLPNITADQIYTGSLGNSGENLELSDSSNNLIDSAPCSGGWFAGDNATKQTMERKIPASDGTDSSNWQTSQGPGGTPKSQNSSGTNIPDNNSQNQLPSNINTNNSANNTTLIQSPKAEAGDDITALVGQEINFDGTKSSDPQNKQLTYLWNFGDGAISDKVKDIHSYKYPGTYIISLAVNNGQKTNSDTAVITVYSNSVLISEFIPNPSGSDKENEWIELYNNSGQVADLSQWQIATQNEKSKPFTFPANTLISGRQFLVIDSQTSKISLLNTSGSIKLLYPNKQTAQEIKYDKIKEGQSVSLAGNNQYFLTLAPTPGTANIITGNKNTENASPYFTATAQEAAPQQQNINSAGAYPGQAPTEGTFVTAGQIADISINANNANPEAVSQAINTTRPDENSSSPTESQNTNQVQTASLANKVSSPLYLFFLIIILGLASGLGLVKIKRNLKSRALKIPIDWQD